MPKLSLNASKKTKHTPAGDIPVDWACGRLDQVTDAAAPIVYGIVQAGPNISDGIPYIRSTNVGGLLNNNKLLRTTPEIANKYRRSEVIENDIVFSLRGNIGASSIVTKTLTGANLTQGTARIRVTTDHDYRYVRYALKETKIDRRINAVAKGSALQEITLKDLRQVTLRLPPLPEQQKIANILSTWDTALEKLDALIPAKTRRKQALMQQLLRRIASTDELGHDRHRFGDIVSRVTRKNSVNETNVLTISAKHGLISQKDYFKRNVAGKDLSKYYLLKKGEFAYNRSSAKGYPYGALKRLESYEAGVLSTLYLCFKITDKTRTFASYLCHYFESGLLNQGLQAIAKEGARAHGLLNVTASDFLDLDIFLPSFDQQEAIAEVLDTADNELRILKKQRTALEQQKRGLMQQLLTGKVRVKV